MIYIYYHIQFERNYDPDMYVDVDVNAGAEGRAGNAAIALPMFWKKVSTRPSIGVVAAQTMIAAKKFYLSGLQHLCSQRLQRIILESSRFVLFNLGFFFF